MPATVQHTFPDLWAATANVVPRPAAKVASPTTQTATRALETLAVSSKGADEPITATARLRAQLLGGSIVSSIETKASSRRLVRNILPSATELPPGRALLIYSIDGGFLIIDSATGEKLKHVAASPLAEPTVCCPDSDAEILRGDGFGKIWRVSTDQGGNGESLLHQVSLNKRNQGVSALFCDRDHLYVGGSGGSVIVSTKGREARSFHPPHKGKVMAILAAAADVIFTAGEDGNVVAWDGKSHERLLTMMALSPKGHALVEGNLESITSLALISDVIYAGTLSGRLHSFRGMLSVVLHDMDTEAGAPGKVWSLPDGISVTSLLPGGKGSQQMLFVSGSSGYLAAWDCQKHHEVARFTGHPPSVTVTSMALSDARGGVLFSGDDGGDVICHDLQTHAVERVFPAKEPGEEQHRESRAVAVLKFMG